MRKKYSILIVLVGCFSFVGNSQTREIDSLKQALPTMKADTQKLATLVYLTNTLNGYDLENAVRFGKQGVALAQRNNEKAWLPKMQMALGRSFANSNQPDSAMHYFSLAKTGFINQQNQSGLATVLSKMRWVQLYLGNLESAIELSFETIKIYEELGDKSGLAMAYGYLGDALSSAKKYQEAIEYGNKAYEIQTELDLQSDLGYTTQMLADSYLILEEYEQALQYINESIAIRRNLGEELNVGLSLNSRGNIYKYTKLYEAALDDYAASRAIAEKAGFNSLIMTTISNAGDVLNRMQRFAEAIPYHLQRQKFDEQNNEVSTQVENFLHLANAYAGIGKFDSAFYYQKLHTDIGDSLLTVENNARIAELETQYQTAKKETQIALQQEQLNTQQATQRFTFGILGLLLLVAASLFYGFRNKQKSNQLLTEKNQEITLLLKEIHHRVKNNLQIISSLLNLQTQHIQDEAALDAVREGRARVQSMSLIHQKLYTTDNVSTIDMPTYLQELSDNLLETFGIVNQRIRIHQEVEAMSLDVDLAIPLGLIINELVTNSLKYAFSQNQVGKIDLYLKKTSTDQLLLRVADNGIGQTESTLQNKKSGFGINLVKMLSKKLKGTPQMVTELGKGMETTVLFDYAKLMPFKG